MYDYFSFVFGNGSFGDSRFMEIKARRESPVPFPKNSDHRLDRGHLCYGNEDRIR